MSDFGLEGRTENEFAGSSEAVSLADNAATLLDEFGIRQALPGGQIVTTTHESAIFTLDGRDYHLRPMRYVNDPNRGDDIFLVLDRTPPADTIHVDNPDLIRIEVGDKPGESPGLVVDQGEGLPSLNNPSHVRTAFDKLHEIRVREAESAAVENAARSEEAAEKRQARHEKLKGISSTVYSIGKVAVGGLAFGAAVFGTIKYVPDAVVAGGDAIIETDNEEIAEFDAKELTLENGTVVCIGQTASPDHSFELLQSEDFDRHAIPELGRLRGERGSAGPNVDGGDPVGDYNPGAPELIDVDKHRQFVINGRDEEISGIRLDSIDDCIVAWTDAGENAARDLDVTLLEDRVIVDYEKSDDADDLLVNPRVVIKRLPADQSS